MVLGAICALAGIIKVRYSYTAVDSHVFRLHYRWTTAFCFACCALVAAKEYWGNAIECISEGANEKAVTTYCWISSSFTINSTGPIENIGLYDEETHNKRFHAYYQWVPLVLFIQGCLFYVPHMIWKWFEGKQVDNLLQDLNKGLFDDDRDSKLKNIVSYLKESWGLNMHYAFVYHACEALNLAIVLLQMYAMDKFLGGEFWEYGSKILGLMIANDDARYDALASTFPRLTQCTFRKFGPSLGLVPVDALCVLPQNIVNEKIYLVMWVWFVVLATITALWLIWRMVVLFSPSVRRCILERLLKSKITNRMEQMVRCLHIGDFCILETVGYNLDIIMFKDVVQGITDAVEEYDPSAPIFGGTYKPYARPDDSDMMPIQRFIDNPDNAS